MRFRFRALDAVMIVPEALGGFYCIAGDQGWLHGSLQEAIDHAQRLARQHGLPVRALLS